MLVYIDSRYLFIEFGFYNSQTKKAKKGHKQMIIPIDYYSFLSNKNKMLIYETI